MTHSVFIICIIVMNVVIIFLCNLFVSIELSSAHLHSRQYLSCIITFTVSLHYHYSALARSKRH